MDKRPIGIFDSGLGGLTAVKAIIERLPDEDIVYFGDTGRVPYGTRSRETIIRYSAQDIRFLITHNVKMIIAACGTASSVALDEVKGLFDLPIVGVVEASANAAAAATKTGNIAVLGTKGTIASGAYQNKLEQLGVHALTIACPMFVPLVENGLANHRATRLIAEEYLAPVINSNIDTIILGCTHYPLLSTVISDIIGSSVRLIDSGAETAATAHSMLTAGNALNSGGGTQEYFVSDSTEGFASMGSVFLGKEITNSVRKINIDTY